MVCIELILTKPAHHPCPNNPLEKPPYTFFLTPETAPAHATALVLDHLHSSSQLPHAPVLTCVLSVFSLLEPYLLSWYLLLSYASDSQISTYIFLPQMPHLNPIRVHQDKCKMTSFHKITGLFSSKCQGQERERSQGTLPDYRTPEM